MSLPRYFLKTFRSLRNYYRLVEELSSTKEEWENGPNARRNKQLMDQYQSQIKKLAKVRMCAEVAIMDDEFLTRCLAFYDKLCKFIIALATGSPADNDHLFGASFAREGRLPESPNAPLALAALPEFYVEDIAEFLLFLANWKSDLMAQSNVDVNNFLLLFICRAKWVSNPYLVAKLIEVLFVLVPEIQSNISHRFFENITGSHLAITHLGPALMNFYTRKSRTTLLSL
jgi:ubiquitin conjugation factor E4 B